jgi:hypothetical protein
LSQYRWDPGYISAQINAVVRAPSGLSALFALGMDVEAAKKELNTRAVGVRVFGERYVHDGKPKVRRLRLSGGGC